MKETLLYTICPSYLGQTLIATSEKGICAVLIDSSRENLIADLKSRFPIANIECNNEKMEAVATKVIRSIENPKVPFADKLDTRGSEFQESVWKALRTIPTGRTASYSEVAKILDKPSAFRAVAGACAANAIAVLIPCHRVVKSDGGISGYRWGVERKRQLLQMEGAK